MTAHCCRPVFIIDVCLSRASREEDSLPSVAFLSSPVFKSERVTQRVSESVNVRQVSKTKFLDSKLLH